VLRIRYKKMMKVRHVKYVETSRTPMQMKWLKCATCDEEVRVEESVIDVVCWRCAMKQTEPPEVKQAVEKKKTKKRKRTKQTVAELEAEEAALAAEHKEKQEIKKENGSGPKSLVEDTLSEVRGVEPIPAG